MTIPNTDALKDLYGDNDLATSPIFQGGYINFGYWKNYNEKNLPISLQERIEASIALYDLVLKNLDIQKIDKILEVGCGRGFGAVRLMETFNPEKLTAIDITPQQIERANTIHSSFIKKAPHLEFKNSFIEDINNTNFYTKIYAVEVLQHLPSIYNFAKSSYSLLKKGGKLVFASHFAVNEQGLKETSEKVPLIKEGIDSFFPIQDVITHFSLAGFKQKKITSIGSHVFKGFNQWLKQVDQTPWGPELLNLFNNKHIDYFLCVFEK